MSLQLSKNIQKLIEEYELFLECLSSESGPVEKASAKLTREWNDIKQKCEYNNMNVIITIE